MQYVVVCPEHYDSSGSVTTFPDDDTPVFIERPSEARLINSEGVDDKGFEWRNGQICQRVDHCFAALGSLLRDAADPASPWYNRIDSDRVVMAGHSFGGGTAVAACTAAPPGSGGVTGCAFDGFRCGVVLDGWLLPLVGDGPALDTTQIDAQFAHPAHPTDASALTPLLFMDAGSFLADPRWWSMKQELVNRGAAAGQNGSALLNLDHSAHHSFSDVNIVGEKVRLSTCTQGHHT